MSERAQTTDEEIEEALKDARSRFYTSSASEAVILRALARTVQAIERERCAKVAEKACGCSLVRDQHSAIQACNQTREVIAVGIRNPESSL